jgi:hypothetical protein
MHQSVCHSVVAFPRSVLLNDLLRLLWAKQDEQRTRTYNVALRGVRVTAVAMEKQQILGLYILSVCL